MVVKFFLSSEMELLEHLNSVIKVKIWVSLLFLVKVLIFVLDSWDLWWSTILILAVFLVLGLG